VRASATPFFLVSGPFQVIQELGKRGKKKLQQAHSEASERSDDIQYSSERKEEHNNGRNAQHERDSSPSRTIGSTAPPPQRMPRLAMPAKYPLPHLSPPTVQIIESLDRTVLHHRN